MQQPIPTDPGLGRGLLVAFAIELMSVAFIVMGLVALGLRLP